MRKSSWSVLWGLTLVGGLCLSGTVRAGASAGVDPVIRVSPKVSELKIAAKAARIVETNAKILRVDDFDPSLIRVTALTPTRLRIEAVTPGSTKMVITDENAARLELDISVTGD